MDTTDKKTLDQQINSQLAEDIDRFPGAAIDSADDEKDDARLVRERTSTLNNNPRNTDL